MTDAQPPVPEPTQTGAGEAQPPAAGEQTSAPEARQGTIKRAQAAAEKARKTADVLMEQAEASRGSYRTIDVAFDSWDRDKHIAGPLLAGALAFRLFLVLLPTILAAVGGLGLWSEPGDIETAAREVGLTAFLADLISSSASNSSTNNIILLIVGLIGMFFGARALLKALHIIHSLAWRLPQPKGVATMKATAWTMLAICAVWGVSLLYGLFRGEVLGLVASVIIGLCIDAGLVLALQWVMPRAEGTGLRQLWPGAAIGAVGIYAVHLATQFYLVGKAASYSDIYGGLGVAAVLLLWLYLLGRLFVVATVVNATAYYKGAT